MTGNVAQVFLTGQEWATTLRAVHETLRPGCCGAIVRRSAGGIAA